MEYCIISFFDFHVVLNKWVTEDNKFCYWPLHKTIGRYLKKLAGPENNWETRIIVAYFGPYGKFYLKNTVFYAVSVTNFLKLYFENY